MAEYYFSGKLDPDTTLCIAPLTNRRVELSGEDLEDTSGYFLYATRSAQGRKEVEILAHVTSEEAAFKLKHLLNLE